MGEKRDARAGFDMWLCVRACECVSVRVSVRACVCVCARECGGACNVRDVREVHRRRNDLPDVVHVFIVEREDLHRSNHDVPLLVVVHRRKHRALAHHHDAVPVPEQPRRR
jgi:hypothetical protein